MLKSSNPPLIMEITIISAEGLRKKSSSSAPFSHDLRPFMTLSTSWHRPAAAETEGEKPSHVYKTRVDDQGGVNPTWGDKFRIPILDPSFLYQRHSCLYLQLYTKRLVMGAAQLGWCQIPASDIVGGMPPPGSVRRLSYRLRAKDGSKGHGIVNIAVKLEGSFPVMRPQRTPLNSELRNWPDMGFCQMTVIGIPVSMPPAPGFRRAQVGLISCKEASMTSSGRQMGQGTT